MSSTELENRLLAYQRDPALYVREVMGAKPSDQQCEALNALANPNCRLTVKSGISTGKTCFGAWAIHWHVDCLPGSKIAVTAPTKPQLKDAMVAEVQKWQGNKHPLFRARTEVTGERIFVKSERISAFATFKTASKENPEALQGLHEEHVMALVDEAAGVPDNVFLPLRGATGTKATRIVYLANPNRATGIFHQTHTANAYRHWTRLTFNSWDSPNAPKDYLQELKETYGETSDMYRVRVLGQFPAASPAQLIPTDVVDAAVNRFLHLSDYDFEPVYLGVDVARQGDDACVIYLRQGNYSKKLFKSYERMNLMRFAERVHGLGQEYKADAIFVDATEMGGGSVCDRLRDMGSRPIEVNFGSAATDDTRYVNKRTEMWVRMAEWLVSGGVIEDDEDVKFQLTGPECYFDNRSRRQLERKRDLKKRLLYSPDDADALATTFAYRVPRKDDPVLGNNFTQGRMDYDIFQGV